MFQAQFGSLTTMIIQSFVHTTSAPADTEFNKIMALNPLMFTYRCDQRTFNVTLSCNYMKSSVSKSSRHYTYVSSFGAIWIGCRLQPRKAAIINTMVTTNSSKIIKSIVLNGERFHFFVMYPPIRHPIL
jgi:hypothetical protein